MSVFSVKMTRGTKGRNLSKMAAPGRIDMAVILVEDDSMAPAYCQGDVVLYQRPNENLSVKIDDDVLVLLPGLACSRRLYLRRVARWSNEILELYALNRRYPPIYENSRHVVLCGKIIGRMD